jgi:hypothetical protein
LRAVECLHLGLLVDTQHRGALSGPDRGPPRCCFGRFFCLIFFIDSIGSAGMDSARTPLRIATNQCIVHCGITEGDSMTYRLYLLDRGGRICEAPREFDSADDTQALERAQGIAHGQNAELWQDSRLVALSIR